MADWNKIAKLAGMLGSAHDGERLAALSLVDKALKAEGLTWGDFANRIAQSTAPRPFGPSFYANDPMREWMKRAQEHARQRYQEEERARQRAARNRGEW